MCLQLADLSLCHPKGILDDVCLGVGRSYVAADFVIAKTGGCENAPIILGHPFLATARAIIYADAAKIVFTINGRKDPRYPYPQEHEPVVEKKRRDRRRNKNNNQPQPHVKEVWMINTIQSENENLLPSPLLPELEDPAVPSIHCSINQWNFQRVCDTGSGINLMSKVTYELIYGDLPLYSTYIMLQMADQSQRFPEGIARDVPVEIKDHYVLTLFSHRHGRLARSSYRAWKTVPEHNKSNHLHQDWRDPLPDQNREGTLLFQYLH
jgi:hypothetical protein